MIKSQNMGVRFVPGLGSVFHLRFYRSDGSNEPLSWEDIQEGKRDLGFGDSAAVEIYPPDSEVINDANIRHLWVLPDGVSLPSLFRRSPRRL